MIEPRAFSQYYGKLAAEVYCEILSSCLELDIKIFRFFFYSDYAETVREEAVARIIDRRSFQFPARNQRPDSHAN